MHISSFVVLTVIGFMSSACARRVPEPANIAPGTPHISWVLMYGDGDSADQEFACQSEPRTECVLPGTKPDGQVFADIHIYYHGAGAETRYEGTKSLGYLRGSPESHTSHVSISVRENEAITNESAIGIVTSTPGTYTASVSLTATAIPTGTTHPVQESIQVVVR